MRELSGGTRLANRYTLERRLGRGGDSETWLAKDGKSGGRVALKIPRGPGATRDALRREWQLSIRLMHAHIVRVFEFHDDEATPFYSMQYVDGPAISVLSGAPLSELLPPLVHVADALRYAHAKGIVHRDVKAGNVLLDRNGAPYLIDFGVAAADGAPRDGGSLISASPASLDGRDPEPADDVFALGGLLYELVSGSSPYSATDTAADIRDRVPGRLKGPDGGEVPAAIADLVARMLDKDAARRPDAAAVVAGLEAAGFRRGTAPRRYVGTAAGAGDELIETATLPRRQDGGADATPVPRATPGGGMSPRTLLAALAVLLLLLAGVVFLLPKQVGTVRDAVAPVPAAEEAGDETAAGAADAPPAVPERDVRVRERAATEEILGELLAKMETLEARAVQRWGGLTFRRAEEAYAAGDEAYLRRDYALAQSKYREAIDLVTPLLGEVDAIFRSTLADAGTALEAGDTAEALRLYELAVAISPGSAEAQRGLARAENLDQVKSLTEQGLAFERELDLEAARQRFERAVEIDPQWQPAATGLARVQESIEQMRFEARMSEGIAALDAGNWLEARAAFRRAGEIRPGARGPADGLMQVEQALRLERIATLEEKAESLAAAEEWQEAKQTYEDILEIDDTLAFAQQGHAEASRMASLHASLSELIAAPDSLSAPATMQSATELVVRVTTMQDPGPRLVELRDELSRLLKRAATPLTVTLVSDNMTDVSIYKVGRLGSFGERQLELRPGTYVAVGSRPGYRDVRLEFRVAPEIDMAPVVVRCEERI